MTPDEKALQEAFWTAARAVARDHEFPQAQAEALLCPPHLIDHARTAWNDLRGGKGSIIKARPRGKGFELLIDAPRGELGAVILFVRFSPDEYQEKVVFGAYVRGVIDSEILGNDEKLARMSPENRDDLQAIWRPVKLQRMKIPGPNDPCPKCGMKIKKCICGSVDDER